METATGEQLLRLPDGFDRFVSQTEPGDEVLVCLHGGPGADHRTLLPLRCIADEELQVVLYDQLGSGRSARPDDGGLWTVETFVAEFEMLLDELGLDRVHLLGQSWGGMLGLECALAHQDRIRSLILCDTMASTQAAVDGYGEILARAPETSRAAVAADHEFDPEDGSELGLGLLDLYATHVRRCHPFDLERSRREFLEFVVPLVDDIGPAYEAMWGRSEFSPSGVLRDWDVTDRLGEIEVPTLITCGAHDELTPESCHRPIAEGIPHARWLILGRSSHMAFHESEASFLLAAIRAFVLE
ncbi:MAG TPA: proline iminopeptidase-family hydrolase [Solirubrobacterales bacterium]|nr:proline iminopeptidase-family hydrolase [Solirubrobacterales bacterium]